MRPRGKLVCAVPSPKDTPKLAFVSNLLLPLQTLKKPAGFEIWAFRNKVSFCLFSEDARKIGAIKSQFNAVYPNARFVDAEFNFIPLNPGGYLCSVCLDLEFPYCCIKPLEQFEHDPISFLLEAMDSNSSAMLQVMFKPRENRPKYLQKLAKRLGKLEPGKYEDVMAEASRKLEMPCFDVLVRMSAGSGNPYTARETAEAMANAFAVFNGKYAGFKPKPVRFPVLRSSKSLFKKIVKRSLSRFDSTFILSVPELASLVHLPVGVKIAKVSYSYSGQLPFPETGKTGITIGNKKYRGRPLEEAAISLGDLSRHTYVVGATGTGKTSLLINMIVQAVRQGICIHVIDPHGQMSHDIVRSLPPERLEDVVFLDPLKVRFGVNPFKLPPYESAEERSLKIEIIVDQVVEMMKRVFGRRYWGPALDRTFRNTARFLYLRNDSPTFEDVIHVLQGRTEKLGMLAKDQNFREFQKQLKRMPYERLDAVMNKIDRFAKSYMLRMIFCSRESVNFDELLSPGKVVVWRLSKTELGEGNMQMIGSTVITDLWFHCARREERNRNLILLIIDEFQNFAFLETLSLIVTEARKFGMGLVMSHQTAKQLKKKMFSEVMGNTATKIIFRVAGDDASVFSSSLDVENKEELITTLTSLPDGSAVVKLRAGFGEEPIPPFEIFAPKPVEQRPVDFQGLTERMVERYSVPAPPPPTLRIQTPPKSEVSEDFQEFLKAVKRTGSKGKMKLSKELKISPKSLNDIIERAESEGFVQSYEVETKGRPRTAIKLTDKGEQAFKLRGREGGLLHRELLERTAEYFRRQGYEVEVPVQGGKRGQPDMIARADGETLIIEIEARADHPDQVRRNYEKSRGLGRVIFIVPSEEVGRRVRRIIRDGEVYVLPL